MEKKSLLHLETDEGKFTNWCVLSLEHLLSLGRSFFCAVALERTLVTSREQKGKGTREDHSVTRFTSSVFKEPCAVISGKHVPGSKVVLRSPVVNPSERQFVIREGGATSVQQRKDEEEAPTSSCNPWQMSSWWESSPQGRAWQIRSDLPRPCFRCQRCQARSRATSREISGSRSRGVGVYHQTSRSRSSVHFFNRFHVLGISRLANILKANLQIRKRLPRRRLGMLTNITFARG